MRIILQGTQCDLQTFDEIRAYLTNILKVDLMMHFEDKDAVLTDEVT